MDSVGDSEARRIVDDKLAQPKFQFCIVAAGIAVTG